MSKHSKKSGGSRTVKIAEQILKDLATFIQRELSVSQIGLVTLTNVQLTPDYAHAQVYFTVLGKEPEESLAILQSKAGYFHSLLFRQLHIHTVPTLHFKVDTARIEGQAMHELIEKANQPGVRADDISADLTEYAERALPDLGKTR